MSSENGLNPEDDPDVLREKLKEIYAEMEGLSGEISNHGTKCTIPAGRDVRRVIRHSKSDDPEDLAVTVNTVIKLTDQLKSVGN